MNSTRNYSNVIVTLAGIVNIFGMVLMIIPIIELTPLTLIISAVFGGGLMMLSIAIYIVVVTRDLIKRGIL